jgi:hypothetical protein
MAEGEGDVAAGCQDSSQELVLHAEGWEMNHLVRAEALVRELHELSKQHVPAPDRPRRGGDEIAKDQVAVFGELLVVLARQLDGAQQTVKRLTWVLTALTAFLVIEAVVRYFSH